MSLWGYVCVCVCVCTDKNNRPDPAEFEEFARELMKSGPDMFFARVGEYSTAHVGQGPCMHAPVAGAFARVGE